MGTVYKRKKDGRALRNWTISYFDHRGRRVTESAGTSSKKEAQRILARREERERGISEGMISPDAARFEEQGQLSVEKTLADYLSAFGTSAKKRGKGARRPSTIASERGHLETFFAHPRAQGLGVVRDLGGTGGREAIRAVAEAMLAGGLSGYTVNQRIAALRRFLDWLVAERHAPRHSHPLEEPMRFAAEPKHPIRPLTEDEYERLLVVARERGRETFYVLAGHTGLRRSEMKRLAWADVDLDARVLRLSWRKTKNGKPATIPLTDRLHALLKESRAPLAHPTARVLPTFPTDDTRRKDYTRAAIKHIDEHGRHATLHSVRKYFSTALAARGISMQAHTTLMRHSDPRLTMAVYTELGDATLAAAVRSLDKPASTGESEEAKEESA